MYVCLCVHNPWDARQYCVSSWQFVGFDGSMNGILGIDPVFIFNSFSFHFSFVRASYCNVFHDAICIIQHYVCLTYTRVLNIYIYIYICTYMHLTHVWDMNFSKVNSQLDLLSKMAIELSFENFHFATMNQRAAILWFVETFTTYRPTNSAQEPSAEFVGR